MLLALRTAAYFGEREQAVWRLATPDALDNPNVVNELMRAARHDATPVVRAECVRGLVQMRTVSSPVLALFQELKGDPDLCVRTAAEEALAELSARASLTRLMPPPSR
jgi:hypothetical protein